MTDQQPPLISVIITCYNYAGFVSTAIDSVLSQDYPAKELIVVDDASSDNSRAVIEGYGERLIAVLKDQNGGHGAAFNSGYAASHGEIVMFLDADDFLLPGALDRVAKTFQTDHAMGQYRMKLVDGEGHAYDIFPKLEQPFYTGDQKALALRTGRVETTVTSGLVFGRSFLQQVMPMPPEDFRQGADGYLATLAPLYGPLSDGGAEPISAYRQHGQNHSGFGAVVEKRAKWCLAHDEARYRALRTHAQKLGFATTEPLGWNDAGHLSQSMGVMLHGEGLSKPVSRFRLSLAGLRATQSIAQSFVNRVALSLWWLSLGILPKSVAKNVFAWKTHAGSRPEWVKKAAKTLRGL